MGSSSHDGVENGNEPGFENSETSWLQPNSKELCEEGRAVGTAGAYLLPRGWSDPLSCSQPACVPFNITVQICDSVFVLFCFLFIWFFAALCSLWDLSLQPGIEPSGEVQVLTTRLPGIPCDSILV